MGIWFDIQSHPTRQRPLPHPKPRPHVVLPLSLSCVPRILESVADLQKERTCKRYADERPTAHATMNGRSRVGSAIIQSRKTKVVCVRVYFWRRFSPFLGNSRTDNHTLIYVIPASSFFRSSSENTDCNMTVHFTPLKCENSVGTWAMRMQSNNLALRDVRTCMQYWLWYSGNLQFLFRPTQSGVENGRRLLVLLIFHLLQIWTDGTLCIFCQS